MASPTHIITELRRLIPSQPLSLEQGIELAEQQAIRLRELLGSSQPLVELRSLTQLPDIDFRLVPDLAVAGMSECVGGSWLIVLRGRDDLITRRFMLAREFWRVVMGGEAAFDADERMGPQWTARAAEHFAASLLMPRAHVYEAWARGMRQVSYLAGCFLVSRDMMRRRLETLGLQRVRDSRDGAAFCSPPIAWCLA
ncbi:MAG: ImmA/IrrE family metallo-endopeptidase [Mycobacteriales bacterium]